MPFSSLLGSWFLSVFSSIIVVLLAVAMGDGALLVVGLGDMSCLCLGDLAFLRLSSSVDLSFDFTVVKSKDKPILCDSVKGSS